MPHQKVYLSLSFVSAFLFGSGLASIFFNHSENTEINDSSHRLTHIKAVGKTHLNVEVNTRHPSPAHFRPAHSNPAYSNPEPKFVGHSESDKHVLKDEENEYTYSYSKHYDDDLVAVRKQLTKEMALSNSISEVTSALSADELAGWGIDNSGDTPIAWIALGADTDISDETARIFQENPEVELRFGAFHSLKDLEQEKENLTKILQSKLNQTEFTDELPLYTTIDMENNQLLVVLDADALDQDVTLLKDSSYSSSELVAILQSHIDSATEVPVSIALE